MLALNAADLVLISGTPYNPLRPSRMIPSAEIEDPSTTGYDPQKINKQTNRKRNYPYIVLTSQDRKSKRKAIIIFRVKIN